MNFTQSYMKLLRELTERGNHKEPRGLGVNFFQNYLFQVDEPGDVFSCESRKYRWDYVTKELELYFSGEMSAEKFGEASKFWLKLANPDGNINSNYGNLVFYKKIKNEFGEIYNQWTWAKSQLIADKDTRQALIFISSPHVQFEGNKDFICTLNYTFSIYNDVLSLEVNRRSQDVILGLPYDYVFEHLLLVKMHNELLPYYPDLKIGSYTMFCNNIHLYDKNKDLVRGMLENYEAGLFEEEKIMEKLPSSILTQYVFDTEFGNPGNNRVFFIEGLDRTGKSTFSKNLCEALKRLGKKPVLYHMTGPSGYEGLDMKFTADEKSIIQLSKFDEDFKVMEAALDADENLVFILDRSQFGERVWSEAFSREGKCTQYNVLPEFYKRYDRLLRNSLYIDYQMSNIEELKKRYLESPEDIKNMQLIASHISPMVSTESPNEDASIDIGIQYCLNSFSVLKSEAERLVKVITIDAAKFTTLEDNEKWVNEHAMDLIQCTESQSQRLKV